MRKGGRVLTNERRHNGTEKTKRKSAKQQWADTYIVIVLLHRHHPRNIVERDHLEPKVYKTARPPPVMSVKTTIYLEETSVIFLSIAQSKEWSLTCIVWDLDNLVDEGDKIRRIDSIYRRDEVCRHQAVLVGRRSSSLKSEQP
jgi:hypothetical protein